MRLIRRTEIRRFSTFHRAGARVVLGGLSTAILCSHIFSLQVIERETRTWPARLGFVHNPVVFGHVHMAKTAGTEINGELAARYERVCGNKGYSYDAHKYNDRNNEWIRDHPNQTLGATLGSRGRVAHETMDEAGYHDCDWISMERPAKDWQRVFGDVAPMPQEIHVPCRRPLDHFLSMCNQRKRKFRCDITDQEIPAEVNRCLVDMDRFDPQTFLVGNIGIQAVKCFNAIPVQPYIDYMGTLLQEKRIVRPYVHRETNKKRDKARECLQTDAAMKGKVERHLIDSLPYFSFCMQCLGSTDDLLASHYEVKSPLDQSPCS